MSGSKSRLSIMADIQRNLFRCIQEKLGTDVAMAKVLEQVLNQRAANIYKKIKGEIGLSLEECNILLSYFKIPSHVVFQEAPLALAGFRHAATDSNQNNALDFLQGIQRALAALRQLPHIEIWYASNEIPLFYYLLYPELTAFKLYVWNKTNWQHDYPDLTEQITFSPDVIYAAYPEIENIQQQLSNLYFSCPATEFWPKHLLEHTLNQIQVCYSTGELGYPLKQKILDQLSDMLIFMQDMAVNGKRKDGKANFELYLNDIAYTSNTILIRSNKQAAQLFTVLDNPNHISTNDAAIMFKVQNWLERIRLNTVKISREGERFRNGLFLHYNKRVKESF